MNRLATVLPALLALAACLVWLRDRPVVPLAEGTRLMDSVGWAAVLPQMLASLGFVPDIFSSSHKFLTKEQIVFCHGKGMQVIPWTINTTAEMQKFSAWQVDGIITDYPNRAPQFLKP